MYIYIYIYTHSNMFTYIYIWIYIWSYIVEHIRAHTQIYIHAFAYIHHVFGHDCSKSRHTSECDMLSYVLHVPCTCVPWRPHEHISHTRADADEVICATWLMYIFDIPYAYVWHDPCICVTWLVRLCAKTHPYVWHGLLICVTWSPMHMRDLTHSHVCHDSCTYVTWRLHICDMTNAYVWHDSCIYVTWLMHMCDMTHSYVHTRRCRWTKRSLRKNSQVSLQRLLCPSQCHQNRNCCWTHRWPCGGKSFLMLSFLLSFLLLLRLFRRQKILWSKEEGIFESSTFMMRSYVTLWHICINAWLGWKFLRFENPHIRMRVKS